MVSRLAASSSRTWLGILVFVLALASCSTSPPPGAPQPSLTPEVDSSLLSHLSGVYALDDYRDVPAAKQYGIDTVVGRYSLGYTAFNQSAQHYRVSILDTYIQKKLYRAWCPSGPSSCAALTPGVEAMLLQDVKRHVEEAAKSKLVHGYYLVDDYYADMIPLLSHIYAVIRSVDVRTPTICAFFLPLDHSAHATSNSLSQFDRALRNYSPQWCNSTMIYAYTSTESQPDSVPVDWAMTKTLGKALETLRAHGWQPSREPLIGVPQAFGFGPRTVVRGQPLKSPQYVTSPTTEELARQIKAFCAAGASSIIAYAWNDGSTGNVMELRNSAQLRAGYVRGVETCQNNYWR